MPHWSDFFKLFQNSSEKDPLSNLKDPKNFTNAGVTQPEALGITSQSGLQGSLRDSTSMIDTTSLLQRGMRYKEYERLRTVPEIEMAMTVFSDEACVSGNTKVATPFGFVTIKELAEKKPDDRFLVYCYDFEKKDYSLGWAYSPRLVKIAKTIILTLDNGSEITLTEDHKILKKDGTWIEAGKLRFGDELMPFYRITANTNIRHNQYPRLLSQSKGWIHERQFVDDWKSNKTSLTCEKANKVCRMIGGGLTTRQIGKHLEKDWTSLEGWLYKEGLSSKEVRNLYKKKDRRTIVGIHQGETQEVYDLSVEKHKCFATDNLIVHNCQKDEEGNVLKVTAKNERIKEEVEFLLLHRKMLNLNRNAWTWFKNLCIQGDLFLEMVINTNNPKEGIYKVACLPPETMFRIVTVQDKTIEYQQSDKMPDYQAIINDSLSQQSEDDLKKSSAIRFDPSQIIHFRIGDDRKNFYPYGQSLIEPARGPAHNLRLMEDSMVIYRLTRAPERRVFYIDTAQLPPFKAQAYMKQLQDQFRKRKVATSGTGANSVDEKWHPPAQDEDYWIPTRPNSNTRIETLPGAENLGEIDDAVYFRNKLLISLNFPRNRLNSEDPNVTRITLSVQDVNFARTIERLQGHFEDGILELAERHLQLRGFPEESYQDLRIKMTAPSEYREASRADIITARFGNANSLKSGLLMSDYDIMIKILKYSEEEAEEMLARLKIQKLEDLKLQVLSQNPQLLGVGIPDSNNQSQEIGSEPGGPSMNPEIGNDPNQPQDPNQQAPENPVSGSPLDSEKQPSNGLSIPDPDENDVKKYDLEIQNYENEIDNEPIDYSIGD